MGRFCGKYIWFGKETSVACGYTPSADMNTGIYIISVITAGACPSISSPSIHSCIMLQGKTAVRADSLRPQRTLINLAIQELLSLFGVIFWSMRKPNMADTWADNFSCWGIDQPLERSEPSHSEQETPYYHPHHPLPLLSLTSPHPPRLPQLFKWTSAYSI